MSTNAGSEYEQLRLRCGFGRLGLCCTDCLRGPCRLSPFEDEPGRGACGRDIDTLVAHQAARVMVDGLAALLAERPDGGATEGMDRSVVELVAALARTGEGDDWQVMLSQVRETAGRLVRSIGPSEEPGGLERDAGMKSAITFCAPRSAGIGPEDTLPSVEAVAEAMRGHRVAGLAVLWDSDLCPEETAALTQALVCSRMLCFSARHSRPIGAIVALSQAIRDALRGERLPLVAAFPRLSSPAIAAVALGLAAQGVAAHTGASLPVGGSAAVMGWLASPPRYSGIAPLFTAAEPPSPRQMVARLLAWLERP